MVGLNLVTEIFNPEDERHLRAATQLVEFQAQSDSTMLPITINGLKNHALGVMALDAESDDFLGYNAVTRVYQDKNCIEIGSLFVAPHLRGGGRGILAWGPVKQRLFAEAKQKYPEHLALVFVNDRSYRINAEICGFEEATEEDVAQLGDALEICKIECPGYAAAQCVGKMCCDTILVKPVNELPTLDEFSVS